MSWQNAKSTRPRRGGNLIALGWGLLSAVVVQAIQAQTTTAYECVADLDALAPYMLANDAGARDHVAQKGQATFDAAFVAARGLAVAAVSDDSCLAALRTYLMAFRRTHLSVRSTRAVGAVPRPNTPEPEFRIVSARTALLSVPSSLTRRARPLPGSSRRTNATSRSGRT